MAEQSKKLKRKSNEMEENLSDTSKHFKTALSATQCQFIVETLFALPNFS